MLEYMHDVWPAEFHEDGMTWWCGGSRWVFGLDVGHFWNDIGNGRDHCPPNPSFRFGGSGNQSYEIYSD